MRLGCALQYFLKDVLKLKNQLTGEGQLIMADVYLMFGNSGVIEVHVINQNIACFR